MHLKMKTSMGGPDISVANGDELPFDENFPFSTNEVHRFCAANTAELIGSADEIAAWLKANPYVAPVEPTIVEAPADETGDAAQDDADAPKDAAAPTAKPAGKPATGAAAKKA